MRKILFIFALISFLTFGFTILAQEGDSPKPGLTPDSPFYFLKTWKEKIQIFFTFGAENKAKQFLHLSEVRMAEYQKMIEKEKTEIAEKTLEKYEKQLSRALVKAEKAKEKGKDVENLIALIAEKTLKHQKVLSEIYEKVPEQAKKGIENAIENSSRNLEKILEMGGKKKGEAPKETCKNLCGDGICQEIVCMAIGCPCPETKESCPQDCVKKDENIKEDLDRAKETLINFFSYLHDKQFNKAVSLFEPEYPDSWEGLASFSLPEDRNDRVKVLARYCESVGTCLRVKVLSIEKVSKNEFKLKVQFVESSGEIYVYGPCCGATEEQMPSTKEFDYKVKKIDGVYKVVTAPLYRP